MTNGLFDAAVWEKAWKEDAHTSVKMMKNAGIDPTHAFDHKAHVFNKEVFSEEGRRRARRITGWLEDQGVVFKGSSVLDIGAASGGFTVPFAAKGASVTAVEPSLPLAGLMKENLAGIDAGSVEIINQPFEDIDTQAQGWEKAFDIVFVSMCPVWNDWEDVEKLLGCARDFCYLSTMVGTAEHSLLDEVWPLVSSHPRKAGHMEMSYLTQLLLLKGYAFQSLVTREMKTTVLPHAVALEEAMTMLKISSVSADEQKRVRGIISGYLEQKYPSGEVTIRQGGRFGKVLVRLQSQQMYSREE